MNGIDSVEHDLIAHLRSQGDRAPDREGWNGVLDRVQQRERRRRHRRTTTTALALVAVFGAMLSLANRSGLDGRAVETGPVAGAEAQLPRFLLDVAGYQLDSASQLDAPADPAPETRRSGPLRLSVLTEPGRGYDGRVLFVTVAAPGSHYGVGDRSSEARAVPVAGHDAWLQQYSTLPVWSLGWYTPEEAAVHLVGLRLSEDALVAAGGDLRVMDDGAVSWASGGPSGLVEQRTVDLPLDARSTAEVRYVGDDGQLTLRIQDGGQPVLDDLVRDRAVASAEIRQVEVGGVPAVLARYEAGSRSSLMWEIRPGVVAELVARGAVHDDIAEVAGSVTEVGQADWQAVLAPFAPPANDPAAVADITVKVCQVRAQWLEADGPDRAASTRTFASLRPYALSRGVDERSDILADIDRLTTAMVAGDEATVRATPVDGNC